MILHAKTVLFAAPHSARQGSTAIPTARVNMACSAEKTCAKRINTAMKLHRPARLASHAVLPYVHQTNTAKAILA
jgi:hypothetical protein